MKYCLLSTILLCFSIIGCTQSNKEINGSFELLNNKHEPSGWKIDDINKLNKAYSVALDSSITEDGKYSLSITKKTDSLKFGTIKCNVIKTFIGHEIELKGYLKLENVNDGFAGLWLRIDGPDGALAFDNMQTQNIKGTIDWKEYNITLPYDDVKATKIVLGGLLVGSGKIWLDNLRLFIDGKPIDQAFMKTVEVSKAKKDTSFQNSSLMDTIKINKQKIINLTLLCQVWGFLKYYHNAIAKGNYNMDSELFRVMPGVVASKNNTELSDRLEKWVDKFGKPDLCIDCQADTEYKVAEMPDYGSIFDSRVLKNSLIKKLKNILVNRNYRNIYYLAMASATNPLFIHEDPYVKMIYPDVGYRLLSLFRYWNIIQYFYPYKHLITDNWNQILPLFIPRFIKASNSTEYELAVLKLICTIHDTHAILWSSSNSILKDYRGHNILPIEAKFIENKLVVTDHYINQPQFDTVLQRGDIITKIEGQKIKNLINKYLPILSGSNYSAQLRDLPKEYLLRTNKKKMKIEFIHNRIKKSFEVETVNLNTISSEIYRNYNYKHNEFSLINKDIGYLFPGKYKNVDLPQIEKCFLETKGIIIDMRCYPSDFMPFTFVPFVKTGDAPFAEYTRFDISRPGMFLFHPPIFCNSTNIYKGKVIVIVNEETQSQAEFTTMAFQSSPNVTVIGSTTAGADGDVSKIILPGGINTKISGLGILYPDGTETQRSGVKINYLIKPTIKGVKEGKDELLEKAEKIIQRN